MKITENHVKITLIMQKHEKFTKIMKINLNLLKMEIR